MGYTWPWSWNTTDVEEDDADADGDLAGVAACAGPGAKGSRRSGNRRQAGAMARGAR